MKLNKTLLFFIVSIVFNISLFAQKQYYLTINSQPKYKKDFKHFDYVSVDAKKGGILKAAGHGTYDSFNMFTLKGTQAYGLGLMYDSLMTGSLDESSVYYPLIAKAAEVSPNNDWVKFYINEKAKFQDGKPITAQDVKFTFDLLLSKGSPWYKRYYFDVKEAIVVDDLTIKFTFKRNNNKELPVILASLVVLPKHFWKDKDFLDSDSIIPVGSGAYKIDSYKFAKYITYKLDDNYWAKDLNVNVGMYNFDKIQYDYYKDGTVAREAFKAGNIDFIHENTAKNWATMYEGEKFKSGKIIKDEIKHELVQGMQAFVFNTRKELFKSIEVRKAMNLAFDFEWTNKKLFYNQYKRTNSYFANSELAAKAKPSKEELELLLPYKDSLPKEVFGKAFVSNITSGSGNIRKELRTALRILKKQGWKFNKNKILQKGTKEFKFEILLGSSTMEKVFNTFIKNLKKIGIIATLRVVDQVSYANRLRNFDFDMISTSYRVSSSPGNELRNFWGSKSADIEGSRNFIGIKSKAVDGLIDKIVTAPNRKALIIAVRALDRVLTHNYFVVPNWYISSYRIAYWNKFNKPKISPKYGFGLYTWWIKKEYR